MTFRAIPLTWPDYSLPMIRSHQAITRQWSTGYRGWLAFVSGGETWMVAELTHITAFTIRSKPGLPERKGYHWHLSGFKCAVVPCGHYYQSVWESPRGPEPPMLNAGAQAALSALFPPATLPVLEDDVEALYRALKAAKP